MTLTDERPIDIGACVFEFGTTEPDERGVHQWVRFHYCETHRNPLWEGGQSGPISRTKPGRCSAPCSVCVDDPRLAESFMAWKG
jgi:hypothetical protein